MRILSAAGGILALAITLSLSPALAAPQATTPATSATQPTDAKKVEAEVQKVIDSGIKLLEAKDYAGAFKLLAGPVAEKAQTEGVFDKMVEAFKAGMGDELLKGLKDAKDSKATVEEDGQTVNFDISAKFPDAPKMSFKKWEKGWYLE